MKISESERIALCLCGAILSTTNPDSDHYIGIELTDETLTDFFTALTQACAIVYGQITGDDKGFFEYAQMSVHLIMQNMMEDKNAKEI